MAFTKTPARGSYIGVKINSNYVNIPGVEGIPAFGAEKQTYENTAIDDTARTYNDDLPDFGSFTLAGSADSSDTAHTYLRASAANTGQIDDFQVTYKSGATAVFNALVTSWKVSAVAGQDEKFEMGVKLTGAVNFTAAT